jgi:general secretion pathway protein G
MAARTRADTREPADRRYIPPNGDVRRVSAPGQRARSAWLGGHDSGQRISDLVLTSSSSRLTLGARLRAIPGYSFVELLVVSAILLILASAVLPLSKVTIQRQREAELRRALRTIRSAIDKHKDAVDLGLIGGTNVVAGSEGYPKDLETLVEGLEYLNDASGVKHKFLRRVPFDPMTKSDDWGLRAYQDDPDSTSWGGDNVYDVYTTFSGSALDGTNYSEW